jgi:hypothetical protein
VPGSVSWGFRCLSFILSGTIVLKVVSAAFCPGLAIVSLFLRLRVGAVFGWMGVQVPSFILSCVSYCLGCCREFVRGWDAVGSPCLLSHWAFFGGFVPVSSCVYP